MRLSRMITTLGIWIAGIFGVQQLLGHLTYQTGTEPIQIVNMVPAAPDGTLQEFTQTILNPVYAQAAGSVQIMVFILCFMLIVGLFISTSAIWGSAGQETGETQSARASRRQSEKLKREQRERMMRLMERMDEDDLAALEYHLSDDGELARRG